MKFLALLFLLGTTLWGENYSADPSCRSFEMRQPKKYRIDTFDFEGDYPELENIDIDGTRKKNVEFYLTGNYPTLETVHYEGCFGKFNAEMTGSFPKLALVDFVSLNCAMNLDLNASWEKSCEINIQGGKENIVINLPKDVGLIINTRTAAKGKVVPCDGLIKKKWVGLFKKTYENELVQTAPIVITLNIALTDGTIILK